MNDSSKDDFNQNAEHEGDESHNEKTYSDIEARQALDNYQKVAEPEGPDEKFMRKLENEYLARKQEKEVYQGMQNRNLKMGIEIGIHHTDSHGKVTGNQEKGMQELRDTIMDEAKKYYKDNYSLGKNFDDKSRDKGNEMEMDI